MKDLLTTDFRNAPYWWDAAPLAESAGGALAPSYDAVIVGSGYTGLRAALTLARAGRSVAVFDNELPGHGASRRNAGFLGRTLKKSYIELKAAKGAAYATAIYRDLSMAYESTLAFIAEEGIDCHAVRCGRLIAATSAAHYAGLERELAGMKADLGLPYSMVPRARLREEMATDLYEGGAVIPDLGSLHPGLYHRGLMERALSAGITIFGNCEVTAIAQGRVATTTGETRARDVVVATNGYTPKSLRWHARRVIPFVGYMAATEPLPPALLEKQLPQRRTVIDSNLNIDFFRPAPDSPRLLFGGATANGLKDPAAIAALLHGRLARALPDLADVKLSHVWTGQCAGTFDMMPHIGCHDGIWYGMGYNFAGVPMGSFFGLKIAQKILGLPEGTTAFEATEFPTLPFYRGDPWFLPIAMRYFAWKDARLARSA
ncbi:FAD-binding oxidoreductase [Reyranella sp.]|uniref:NAD(P)/FAD-dependent oxidoreductase n=1 Tax=Reyranella sp. TaxID=1929291 RepID=UPI0027310874|nr:FAD-binding oxidoreductase [Reyranella sp.]MDP2376836.1 FAD-binding oxidoreductase [Reyranella sp.]